MIGFEILDPLYHNARLIEREEFVPRKPGHIPSNRQELRPLRGKRGDVDTSPERRHTMTIRISPTPEQERTLEELARQSGKDPSAYAIGVLTAYLNGVHSNPEKTFAEILAPIWEGWRQSGMTEDEIDDLFGQELQEMRRERRPRKATT
jgi:hypothetical protein